MISESVLQGQLVRLRPVEERDLPLFLRWLDDPDVGYWSGRPELTIESEREWYEEVRGNDNSVVWTIETAEGRPIGQLGLHDINATDGRAVLDIFIGAKGQRSRGYGTDAIKRLLRYGFQELGLRLVELDTDEDNLRAIRCYEKCGFVRTGLFQAHRPQRGRTVNAVVMGVLREDFESLAGS